MKPLNVFHVKVHEIAMMMTIALRFIPTLIDEIDRIILESNKMKVLVEKILDVSKGGLCIDKVKSYFSLIVEIPKVTSSNTSRSILTVSKDVKIVILFCAAH